MYVLPSDGVDLHLDEDGTIAGSVSAFEEWFAGQTGGMRLRMDTHKGNLDITFAQLTRTDSEMAAYGLNLRDEVESELIASGFNAPNKLYLVYYGGTNLFACGGAPLPPSLMGNYAVLYLNGMPPGAPPCASNPFASFPDAPGYWEFSGIHELVHAQGFVAPCAPHFVLAGHVSDSPTDLMYAGPEPWQPAVLDLNHDDYFRHNITGCPDLARSAFLDPLPQDAVLPPGWPYATLKNQGCSKESNLASVSATVPTDMQFVNGSATEQVNVYWLDYGGQRQLFRTLGPKEGFVQPTFVTNPWVVTDVNGACIAVYLPAENPGRAIVFGKKHE